MTFRVAIVAAVFIGALISGILFPRPAFDDLGSRSTHSSRTLRAGGRVPATLFVDQRGQPFMLQALRGQTVLLAFVCTRCRTASRCDGISDRFA